jgi:hypothetical protein
MTIKFLHTADWQLGKPFAGIEDVQKRSLLQNERLAVIQRIGDVAREHHAEFVLVAGDLFDSPSATKSTVAAACSAIGALELPVYAIPGNHDHGGAGSLWEQEFFRRERDQLAPNFHVLLKPEPVELDRVVLFPCPLLRRHETNDPTGWLRAMAEMEAPSGTKPRLALAHGSITTFGTLADDEEEAGAVNVLDLQRLPEGAFDYVALGDWHGTKQVGGHAWYSGTPELDRFVKGDEHNPGNVLVVEAARGRPPQVQPVRTGRIRWHELVLSFAADNTLGRLEEMVAAQIGGRANLDLLLLHLDGSLGIEACTRLEQLLESWVARLIRLKLDNRTTIAPTPEELTALTQRAADPLVSRVAARLVDLASGADEPAAVARVALRELHAACTIH